MTHTILPERVTHTVRFRHLSLVDHTFDFWSCLFFSVPVALSCWSACGDKPCFAHWISFPGFLLFVEGKNWIVYKEAGGLCPLPVLQVIEFTPPTVMYPKLILNLLDS